MSTTDNLVKNCIREAREDTKYLCEVILPSMENQGELWPYTATSFIEKFSPTINLACPVVSTCERGKCTRERIFQFYLNLKSRSPVRVGEIHYHDDDLHSRDYHKEMETHLRFAALGVPGNIGIVEDDYTSYLF